MIKTFEELGDVLANIENRISYMENLHMASDSSMNSELKDEPDTTTVIKGVPGLYEYHQRQIDHTRILINDLQARLNKHIDDGKKKDGYLYE